MTDWDETHRDISSFFSHQMFQLWNDLSGRHQNVSKLQSVVQPSHPKVENPPNLIQNKAETRVHTLDILTSRGLTFWKSGWRGLNLLKRAARPSLQLEMANWHRNYWIVVEKFDPPQTRKQNKCFASEEMFYYKKMTEKCTTQTHVTLLKLP